MITITTFTIRIIPTLLVLLSTSLVGMGQQQSPDEAREAVCKRVECRPVTSVKLKLNDNEYFEMEFPKLPYVAAGFINVLAGEEVLVEFDETDGVLSNARYVKTATKPEQAVSFRLEQTDGGTVLTVKNPFAKNIIYDCFIQHYSEQRLRKTSTIPVQARLTSFEMWPYPVAQVVVSNVRYVQK